MYKEQGLSNEEAESLLRKNGPNEVKEPTFNFFKAILVRLWEPSAWILEIALAFEIILGKNIQAGFIVLMLWFAALNGAIQSKRANKVLHSLSRDLTPTVTVKRSGQWIRRPSKNLVVGDLINLRKGDIVPADATILGKFIQINESSVTGESKSVNRTINQPIYAGTEVVGGQTSAIVTAVGLDSRSGKTITLLNRASSPGHLQQLLGQIIKYLALLDSILAFILIVTILVRNENIITMLPFLAMLFIVTIPIAMPSSFSVANSVEANVLSKQNILVSNLSGIQESGNIDVLLFDKTGTITQNKSSVILFKNISNFPDKTVLKYSALACDPQKPSVIDQAILDFSNKRNIDFSERNSFIPFDSEIGYSSAQIVDSGKRVQIYLGSLKILQNIDQGNTKMPVLDWTNGRSVAVMANSHLIGIFIIEDTIRPDSQYAIKKIRDRGIQLVMLTGDNVRTARTVAKKISLKGKIISFAKLPKNFSLNGLAGIAELHPEDKFFIVQHLQKNHIVGMTGDGINDAPALKKSDVGIAVKNAVDLAKRSAKMVLLEDGLSPIIEIIDSGHRVYQRMMTWTITKLSRTAELTTLLTAGYLFFGFVPLSLNAMILVAILNDLVTLVLGTDNTKTTYKPEIWNLKKISFVSGILAIGWTGIGLAILSYLALKQIPKDQISTIIFNYLIFSAMITILITRTKCFFWKDKPSRAVFIAILINIIITISLSLLGLGIGAISYITVLMIFFIALLTGIILNFLYLILHG